MCSWRRGGLTVELPWCAGVHDLSSKRWLGLHIQKGGAGEAQPHANDRDHATRRAERGTSKALASDLIAQAAIQIDASISRVWDALTTPSLIEQYMFGTHVESAWRKGAPITWSGEWKGRAYKDKGIILDIVPPRLLEYTHFSPLAGLPDIPANYHTVTIELTGDANRTKVALSQDNNTTEEARAHSQENWRAMLAAMKALLEKPNPSS
ncbi:MAG TPA: SRPBCC family protein [Gemmatimonadales bacterium]|nr:SRPBCC family protein [Gemmatimonadales bacterium]